MHLLVILMARYYEIVELFQLPRIETVYFPYRSARFRPTLQENKPLKEFQVTVPSFTTS